jgi:Mn-dependent DtxR family transcriptional regulator
MNNEHRNSNLSQSVEDYLESILVLSSQLPSVRSVDVASHLGFSKPSVSHAVKTLQAAGYLNVKEGKRLELTDAGKEAAVKTYQRHVFFTEMLEGIGVSRDVAQEDACKMEHVISDETFEAIVRYYQKSRKEREKDSQN